jgi:hypothetical protein
MELTNEALPQILEMFCNGMRSGGVTIDAAREFLDAITDEVLSQHVAQKCWPLPCTKRVSKVSVLDEPEDAPTGD